MLESTPPNISQLLREISAGQASAADQLLPMVYHQLQAIAQRQMNHERPDHTLQATILVHEAYLRLIGDQPNALDWKSRGHFFAAAAEAMRRILIEHARARARIKRGGGQPRRRLPLNVVDLADDHDPDTIMALDEAIRRLDEKDARCGQVVRLRFFAGLSIDETAAALEVAPRTVKRDWEFARAWLHRAITEE